MASVVDMLIRLFLGNRVLSVPPGSSSADANPVHEMFCLVLTQAIRDAAICVHFSPCADDGELKLSYFIPTNEAAASESSNENIGVTSQPRQEGWEDSSVGPLNGFYTGHPAARWFAMRPIPADLCQPVAAELRLLAGIPKSRQTGSLWISSAGRLHRLSVVACGEEVFVFTSAR